MATFHVGVFLRGFCKGECGKQHQIQILTLSTATHKQTEGISLWQIKEASTEVSSPGQTPIRLVDVSTAIFPVTDVVCGILVAYGCFLQGGMSCFCSSLTIFALEQLTDCESLRVQELGS